MVVIFLGYHFVSSINRLHFYFENRFLEHLYLKPMYSVFTYFWTTDNINLSSRNLTRLSRMV